jgi:perosamine synthetase
MAWRVEQKRLRKVNWLVVKNIPWWQTEFTTGEAEAAAKAITEGRLSQGSLVAEFERKLADYLGVRQVVATTSGSDALLLSLWAANVLPGDEVLVPNRTWIATAHAVSLLGAIPIFVDTDVDNPVISLFDLRNKLTSRTKAVIPVHLNGRNAHIDEVLEFGETHGIKVIEDAAQALGSKDISGSFLGTKSLAGCFSLSVAKVISSGQGGFIATNHDDFAARLRAMRTHGIENVIEPGKWDMPGFNFRFTDVLASIALEQFKKLELRLSRLREIYNRYEVGMTGLANIRMIPLNLDGGEVGPYIEILSDDRASLVEHLMQHGIESRKFYPDLDTANYFNATSENPNSRIFGSGGLYLPSGPSLSNDSIDIVLSALVNF